MYEPHDVSIYMIPKLGRNESDEFGKQNKAARLPLLLPNVMDGRPVVSDSPLFRLPPEILGDIVGLIADDRTTLASLALVNSDCRQLARSCQFAEVCFNYGFVSSRFLAHLVVEVVLRYDGEVPATSHAVRPPFIGTCIRRVTVRPRPDYVAQRHPDLTPSRWRERASFSAKQREKLRKKGLDRYMRTFREPVLAVLKEAVPNLEALSWCDSMCLDDDSLGTITHLPVRHLKLSRVTIGEPISIEQPVVPSALPLESLLFGARTCIEDVHREGADGADFWKRRTASLSLITSLLQRCSTTLRDLRFGHMALHDEIVISFGPERIVFPRLRHLSLSSIHGKFDMMAWSSLLSAPLRHLALPFLLTKDEDPVFAWALSNCQPFRDLETLDVPRLGAVGSEEAQAVMDFISRHPHVCRLSVMHGVDELMDSFLLPCLSDGRWSNLTSLSLAWEGPGIEEATRPNIATISAESLAAIGTIKSLEQLHLTAGIAVGWRHQWLIDHDVVRSNLGGLTRLKKLAFSRDTYLVPGGTPYFNVEGYYEYRIPTPEDLDDAPEWNSDVWEPAHRKRMVEQADKYATLFQGLEWIYCGQWPMDIRQEQTSNGIKRFAVPLGEERDSCWTFLRRIFALGEADE